MKNQSKNNLLTYIGKPQEKVMLVLLLCSTIFFSTSCKKDLLDKNSDLLLSENMTVQATAAAINTYYVSPTGSDNNAGTITAPFATWEKLNSVLVAGDLAYIRGGTYRAGKSAATDVQVRWSNLVGNATNNIRIFAYPGESPVLDLSDVVHTGTAVYGLYIQNSQYVHIKGLRITGLAQNQSGNVLWGWINQDCNNLRIEQCEVDHIGGQGFFDYNSSYTYYLNDDAHHLDDRYSAYAWNGSNGFSATGGGNTSTNITYDGCRAWWVSDDGWDFFGVDGYFTIKNSWSFWNGYQPGTFTAAGDGAGYKLGPTATAFSSTVKRVLTNNLSFQNRAYGYDQNGGNCLYQLYNNTSFGNASTGYMFGYYTSYAQQFKNNISFNDPAAANGSEIRGDHNTWNGAVTVSNTDFSSVSASGADGARQADGSLPNLSFLKLAAGSDLIDAGININLPFIGNQPDMGAYESGTTSLIANLPPVAIAGLDRSITLPTNSISLTGSGTDVDGTIVSYLWTLQSGPNSPTLNGTSSVTLSASNMVAGTYTFRLRVTDNGGLTAFDDVNVVVSNGASLPANAINVSQAVSDGGYRYYIAQNFGTTPDNATNPTVSTLRVFENGVEINPAHSAHSDIANMGGGRYSHWSDGTTTLLYFSASDNSNPKTNGRVYTYTVTTAPPPPPANTPYGGVARAIPGTIQAEDYDNGGQNVAYYDMSTGNAGNSYRTGENVDVAYIANEKSNFVGWTQAGEWLKYTVNVATTKNYTIQLRVATAASGKAVRIEMDGVTVATVNIGNTGGTARWATVSVSNIPLTAGTKVMRIYNVSDGQNINYIKFQ